MQVIEVLSIYKELKSHPNSTYVTFAKVSSVTLASDWLFPMKIVRLTNMFSTIIIRVHFCFQDRSTNSSPVISSAEQSFDKSKLVVRRFCWTVDFVLLHLKLLEMILFQSLHISSSVAPTVSMSATEWTHYCLSVSQRDRTPASRV